MMQECKQVIAFIKYYGSFRVPRSPEADVLLILFVFLTILLRYVSFGDLRLIEQCVIAITMGLQFGKTVSEIVFVWHEFKALPKG